jgi:hypothetical protein
MDLTTITSIVPTTGPTTGGTQFVMSGSSFAAFSDPLTGYEQPGSPVIPAEYIQSTSGAASITADSLGIEFDIIDPGDVAQITWNNTLGNLDVSVQYASDYPTLSNINLNYDIEVAALRLTVSSGTYFEVSHHVHSGSYIQIVAFSGGVQLDKYTYVIAVPTQILRILRIGPRCLVFVGNTQILDYAGWSDMAATPSFYSSVGTGPASIQPFTTTFTNWLLNAVVTFGTEPGESVVVVYEGRIRGASSAALLPDDVSINYYGYDGSTATAPNPWSYTEVTSLIMLTAGQTQLSLSGDPAISSPIAGQAGFGQS